LPIATPSRGENGKAGDARTPGTTVANTAQQAYLADVAAKVVLPMFKARNKPFVLVFWSRDPDGSQHNTGDSLNTITPGINGPTSLAALKNAYNNLPQLPRALAEHGLRGCRGMNAPGPAMACAATILRNQSSWLPPTADRTWCICRTRNANWRNTRSKRFWSRTMSAASLSTTLSGTSRVRCRCRSSA